MVVVAPDLATGVDHVRSQLGVAMPPGGAHPAMATHNHLMRLGDDAYMEVIAIDPDAAAPNRPRWFGLDAQGGAPARLATWVARTDDLDGALAGGGAAFGPAIEMTRGALRWRITVPDDGGLLLGGAVPMLIEWPGEPPLDTMADLGCRLVSLTVEHPAPDRVRAAWPPGPADARVALRAGPAVRLTADIETPTGTRRLT